MKNKLSEYMNLARNIELEERLLDEGEIRSRLGEKSTVSKYIKFPKIKRNIIMTSIALIGISLIFTWFSGVLTTLQINEAQMATKQKLQLAANTTASEKSNAPAAKVAADEIQNNENYSFKGLPLIKLTDKELEKLEVYKIEDGYKITCESMLANWKGFEKELAKIANAGYDTSVQGGIYRAYATIPKDRSGSYIKYNGWDIRKTTGKYPIGFNAESKGGSISYSSSFGSSPLLDYTKGNPSNFYSQARKYLSSMSKNNDFIMKNEDYLQINESEFPALRYLVPVYLDIEKFPNTILWYAPTKEFIACLPQKYQDIIKQNYQIVEKLTAPVVKVVDKEKTALENKYLNNTGDKIAKIPSVELTREELEKLYIFYNRKTNEDFILDDEYYKYIFESPFEIKPEYKEMAYQVGIDTNYSIVLIKAPMMISASQTGSYGKNEKPDWNPDTSNYLKVVPVSVTALTDLYYINRWKESNGYLSNTHIPFFLKDKINEDISELLTESHKKVKDNPDYSNSQEWLSLTNLLIPVHATLGNRDEIDGNKFTDIFFWFFPNEEFLNNLPKKYADPIRKELGLVLSVASGEITYQEACKGYDDVSYLGFCSLNSNLFKDLNIYPNPTKGNNFNLKFYLTEKRKITISIYNINGALLSTKLDNSDMNPGLIELKFELGNLAKGVYQVAIKTEKNEIITRKLILE